MSLNKIKTAKFFKILFEDKYTNYPFYIKAEAMTHLERKFVTSLNIRQIYRGYL